MPTKDRSRLILLRPTPCFQRDRALGSIVRYRGKAKITTIRARLVGDILTSVRKKATTTILIIVHVILNTLPPKAIPTGPLPTRRRRISG